MGYSASTRNALQDLLLGQTAYVPPATLYAALFVSGTEVAVGGYARLAVPNTPTTFATPAYAGQKTNDIALQWPNAATASWGAVDEVRLFTAAVAGTEVVRGSVVPAPKTIDTDDVAYFAPGEVLFDLSSTWETPITAVFTNGQSNDVGQETADAFLCPKTTSVDIIEWPRILGVSGEEFETDVIQPLQRTIGNGSGTLVRGGPECQMGVDMLYLGWQKILILKVAQSGTAVSTWLPGAGTGQYEAIEEELAEAVAAAQAQWPGYDINWNFLFVNGESECGDPFQQYLANMKTFIAALRTTFEATGAIDKIIISQVSVNLGLGAQKTQVRAAQAQLVTDGDATDLINTDDLPLQSGDLHWDGWALPSIGRRAALVVTGGTIPTPVGATAATDFRDLATAQGFSCLQYLQADVGISGSTWQDQSGNAFDMTAGGAPVYTAADATLDNRGSWTYDGIDDTHFNTSTSLLTAPAIQPCFFYGIFRIDSWSLGVHTLWAAHSGLSGCRLSRNGVGGVLWNNGSGGFNLTGTGLSNWRRVYGYFANSVMDEYGVGAESMRGSSLGTNAMTGRRIASDSGGIQFSQQACALAMIVRSPVMDNFPRGLIRALDLVAAKRYPTSELVLPLP